MNGDRALACPACGYEIVTYAEAVEAIENGGKCLLCGGGLDEVGLRQLVERWSDAEILDEGAQRAEDEEEFAEEEAWLDSGPDFGDDGEEEDDELL